MSTTVLLYQVFFRYTRLFWYLIDRVDLINPRSPHLSCLSMFESKKKKKAENKKRDAGQSERSALAFSIKKCGGVSNKEFIKKTQKK
jgi:hypothetical protein